MFDILQTLYLHPLWMAVGVIFVVMLCARYMRMRTQRMSRTQFVKRLRDLDPDTMPNLEARIKWVRIQVIIGILSLIVFVVFFGLRQFF